VHLIRHAEPEVRGLFLGKTDVGLSQAAIPPAPFKAATVFASPLQRARRTAECLFPHQHITIFEGLAERDFGEWEGLAWSQVEQGWPTLASRAALDWLTTTPPGGEPWNCFMERITLAWHTIRQAEQPIAIVAHAGVNSALAELIAGRKPADFEQAYLEVLTLELED
jgi:broad specificity phosphatase PhoE